MVKTYLLAVLSSVLRYLPLWALRRKSFSQEILNPCTCWMHEWQHSQWCQRFFLPLTASSPFYNDACNGLLHHRLLAQHNGSAVLQSWRRKYGNIYQRYVSSTNIIFGWKIGPLSEEIYLGNNRLLPHFIWALCFHQGVFRFSKKRTRFLLKQILVRRFLQGSCENNRDSSWGCAGFQGVNCPSVSADNRPS